MKPILKILSIISIIFVLAIYFSVITSAETSTVVYVSSNGTGDGSSPDAPIGNAAGYKTENGSDVNNAFYRALDKIKSKGGTVVLVGEVSIDTTQVRVPASKSDLQAPAEFRCPQFGTNAKIKITSVYGGKDYRTNGAKLILDHEKCNTSLFIFGCDATIENVDIEYRYDKTFQNSQKMPFLFGGGGYNFVVGEGVKVTSFETSEKAEGSLYPYLAGGFRYMQTKKGTNITVKSGKWSCVIGGSFGLSPKLNKNYGQVGGNVNITIEGGEIDVLVCTGSLEQPSGKVLGDISVTALGGSIKTFFVSNSLSYDGNKIDIHLFENCTLGTLNYAPSDYNGDVEQLKAKTNIINHAQKLPEDTDENDKTPETNTDPQAQTDSQKQDNAEKEPLISPTIIIIILCAALLIAAAKTAIYFIKLRMVK